MIMEKRNRKKEGKHVPRTYDHVNESISASSR
jgi:hypothetical protein